MSITDLSLLEQLNISDREIELRKRLFEFHDDDVHNLVACREMITQHIDEITAEFYSKQVAQNEVALLIGDSDTLSRLQNSMHQYILDLFDGYYDAEYVNKRLRVGKIHKRIGVTPKLYMSAICLLQSILGKYIREYLPTNGDSEATIKNLESLHKILLFDTQLVFDTYINSLMSEVEMAKKEVETYAASLEQTVAERTQQLRELSTRDSLTGLLNRRAFHESLRRELALSRRTKKPLCIVFIDLNDFKKINDSKGHKAGDGVLNQFAEAIRTTLRETDIGCRYGGDEFSLILLNSTINDARHYCERLVEAFSNIAVPEVTASCGIIQTNAEAEENIDSLIARADTCMYQAKARAHAEGGHHIVGTS